MKINRFFGVLFCFFPGAAHLYLGLKKLGVQLMALFLIPLFLSGLIRFSGIIFILPIIWCYSFFDGLRKVNGHEELVDENLPIFNWLSGEYHRFGNKNRNVAYGLIGLGSLLLFEKFFMPVIRMYFGYRVRELIQMGVISLLLIAGGVKLLIGSKQVEGADKK